MYRHDIDGLRAFAVLSVVLFHCGISYFPGGYVGVDIFFVISGYLITTILCREIGGGHFSIVRFYERRLRRIAPALLAVILISSLFAAFILLPRNLDDFAKSVFSTILFSSNIYFYNKIDYFNSESDLMPLLHTWSLSVEEQFYIFFPLLLILIFRCVRAHLFKAIISLIAVSVVISVWQTAMDQSGAFYLPLSRAWELLLGSALVVMPERLRDRLRHPALGWVGLAMMTAAVLTFDDNTRFPGYAALLPCLGATMLIASGVGGAARLMSLRPIRYVGLISYSLYLWHWPILAFYRYVFGLEIPIGAVLGLFALMILAADLSWRFIEAPFRTNSTVWTRQRIFGASALGGGVALTLAAILLSVSDNPARFPAQALNMVNGEMDYDPGRRARCDRPSLQRIRDGAVCEIGSDQAPVTFAVVGDSIGDALAPGIEAAAEQTGRRGVIFTHSGCSPLFDVLATNRDCPKVLSAIRTRLNQDERIKHVIFVGRWATMVEGGRVGDAGTTARYMGDAQTRQRSYAENLRVFDRAMKRMTEQLPGKAVSVVAFVPEQLSHVPRQLVMSTLLGRDLPEGITRQAHENRQRRTRLLFEGASRRYNIQVVDFGAFACDAVGCPIVGDDGRPLYRDDTHPSRTAALMWKGAFVEALAASGRAKSE